MFKHTDILDRIKETKISQKGNYLCHQDGLYFQDIDLLSPSELSMPLIVYIDDLEIADPLGKSWKIHKQCSVYWMVADLPGKYRSVLLVIQLAVLCKVSDLKSCGYQRAPHPWLQNLCTLEQYSVFLECLTSQCEALLYVLCLIIWRAIP